MITRVCVCVRVSVSVCSRLCMSTKLGRGDQKIKFYCFFPIPDMDPDHYLAEHYYVTLGLWHEPFVCRLWLCCSLGRDLNVLAIFLHRLIAQGLGQNTLQWKMNSYSSSIVKYRRVPTRMQSIEWCHFQWPSMTP